MQHGDLIPEVGGKCPEHLRRERNLRHEQDRGAPHIKTAADEVDVDARFAAAGHAVQQRRVRSAGGLQRAQPVKGLLLLRIQHGERLKLADIYLRAAKDLTVRELHKPGLLQRLERGALRPGVAQQITRRQCFKRAQHFQQRRLLRGAATLCLCCCRGVSRRNAQARHFDRLVLHEALAVVVEPQPSGQHGAGGGVHRAEKPVAHEKRELYHVRTEHGAVVRHGDYGLDLFIAAVLRHGEDDAFTAAIALAERDEHAHTGLDAFAQLLRDEVVIRSVYPICSGGNRNFRKSTGHCGLSPLLRKRYKRGEAPLMITLL